MTNNQDMKRYRDPATGDIYWIQPEDQPREGWVEEAQPTDIPLPDPNYIPPYTARRINAYPQVSEQLDMLWHMMDTEVIPGKNSEWYNTILTVKQQYPKP